MYYAVQRWNPSIARANDLDGGAQVRAGTSQAAAELPSCTAQHYFCIYPAGCLEWGATKFCIFYAFKETHSDIGTPTTC